MTSLNFNSRETYLAWRANWKKEYKETSILIRNTRNAIKNQHRTQGYADYETWSAYNQASYQADVLLGQLATAKLQAHAQYLEAKNIREAA